MNQHLSSKEISKYLIGDATSEEAQHAHECTACGDELALLESSLSLFRGSVRQWSDRVSGDAYQIVGMVDGHLNRLLTPGSLDTPWYRDIFRSIKDAIHPPKLAPLLTRSGERCPRVPCHPTSPR